MDISAALRVSSRFWTFPDPSSPESTESATPVRLPGGGRTAGLFHSYVATPVGNVLECDEDNNLYHAVVSAEPPPPPANHPPVFTTADPLPPPPAAILAYNARATDPDNDPLTYDLVVKPDGMAVDPSTGTVVWTPSVTQLGPNNVTIRVEDGRGGIDLQSFTILVRQANTPPSITSTPKGPAVVGVPYYYQVTAQDAEGDPITFSLGAHPDGMAIDPTSGLVTWTPAADQVGSQHVEITASDNQGASTTQFFDLPVVASATDQPADNHLEPAGDRPARFDLPLPGRRHRSRRRQAGLFAHD